MEILWPSDVLESLLRFLAYDGEDAAWYRLAYLTNRSLDLKNRAKSMKRPMVIHICFDPPPIGQPIERKGTMFLLPISEASIMSIEVDWGDGCRCQTFTTPMPGASMFIGHTYSSHGSYRVRIFPLGEGKMTSTGRCFLDYLGYPINQKIHSSPLWWSRIRNFKSWGSLGLRSLAALFRSANFFNSPLPCFGLDTVQSMQEMFSLAASFDSPIGDWKVGNVTNMAEMFTATNFNQSLQKWDVGKVTDMNHMFEFSRFNHPIGNWNVSKVKNMSFMFAHTPFNQSIGSWDVSSATNMEAMFHSARSFNRHIGNWDVSKVTNMAEMFASATRFNKPLSAWNVGNVKDMTAMFEAAENFDQQIETWDVSNVTSIARMFAAAISFNQPLAKWNVERVNAVDLIFSFATRYNHSIADWQLSGEAAAQLEGIHGRPASEMKWLDDS